MLPRLAERRQADTQGFTNIEIVSTRGARDLRGYTVFAADDEIVPAGSPGDLRGDTVFGC